MDNKYLSDEEIIENIKEYIDDTIYNRAILIDGEWGSGKTFFVKNKLIAELNTFVKVRKREGYEKKKIIYISLYGIESTVDITNEIYLKSINIDNKDSKIYSLSKLGGKFLSDLIKNKGLDITKYIDEAKDFIDIANSILIFDDLERCKCDINDILGYINNFVEHRDMKVIIVVNESELGSDSEEKNIYIENIKRKRSLKNKEIMGTFMNNINGENQNRTNEEIESNYNTNKIEIYQKFKEKLIGTTIKYKPNLETSIKVIIEKNIQDYRLKVLLLDYISSFVQIAEEKEHINLRTFQFFISKITKIYLLIKDKNYCKNEEVFEELIRYTYIICIYYKKGIYMNEWNTSTLYGEVALEPYASDEGEFNMYPENIVNGFKFVDDFVVYSKVCNVEIIDRTMELFLEDLKERGCKDDPLKKLETWWLLDDNIVYKNLDEIYNWLCNEKYSLKKFPDILRCFSIMESLGFNKYDIEEEIISIMSKQIESSDMYINYNERLVFIDSDDKEIIKKYDKYLEKLKLAVSRGNRINITENLNQCLESLTTWGNDLIRVYNNIKENEQIQSGILLNIDFIRLKYIIENSNAEQLYKFREFIHSVYRSRNNRQALEKDRAILSELLNSIYEIEKTKLSKIKGNNIKWLKQDLEKLVSEL